ncbi:MAG: Serine hydroxymethyltransferase [candidate division WS6 bacterium GW2011_GWC1_36_11]|uniref:Serine hydroxymethyltransferase n=3 Tax=Candidatus Dojkabacteria TaxID=74243 RepID=A0A0G0DET9_9BACT|nr:MAG: Serine hydroxymethyltransferase [candidate division WS6 bacterium GW2011_GWC1_36_11]KKQ03636.1 MAG: Serine hydroxymethyltransferase [candidate division WS6 bacterium GW2011_WS6_36_26]KKQ11658.1 MAG: Serine hydroxymethyltransferase [candidate division WS6 bacterium GW2011_GWC2_36_7]KKQ17956.1 MAG: Serine hydroxymethyltransferase [candidate division WS6 bacterium GW2011_GWF1_36_8]HAM37655.1 serine hydroxymethyltransferase [Patescibacteria group bacterium]
MIEDKEIYNSIQSEARRQKEGLELIASENYVSSDVLEALGSILTNKYSEGMVNKRYYGGNQFIDEIETTAVNRAKQIFGVDHVNVQPYSGSPANLAVYFALLNPGDKVMGLNLYFGGHLTHGWKVNITGKYFNSVQYETGRDGLLDYDMLEKQVKEEKPKLLFCGATAYPRLYDYKRLVEIAHSVDAYFVADIAHECGLIAAKVIPSPVGFADVITTTTHKTLRGPRGGMIMCNGNPSEPLRPLVEGADPRRNLPTLIDRAVFPGLQGGPHNNTTAAIAVALGEAMKPEFVEYANQILKNAKKLSEKLMEYDFNLISGGTDNHLMLVDLANKNITGKQAEETLEKVGITVNKNTIPFDERKPWDPSGIRIGTPALTTRGMKEKEMEIVAQFIDRALKNPSDDNLEKIRLEVKEFTKDFPIPGIDNI